MNPIVVIGMVSVVVAGLYAVYDGLEKQAELAALHADMLARQHAEHSVFVRGEVRDGGTNIIFINNGPRPAELVQVRAYDAGDDALPLIGTWQVAYEVPPLGRLNLTDASPPPPPPVRTALTGTNLKDSLDSDTSYRGVTSAGGIFEITYDPSSGSPSIGGSFGPMSAVPFETGSGSRIYNGGANTYEFHYADTLSCKTTPASGKNYMAVWDTPFHTGTSYSLSDARPIGDTWRAGLITTIVPSLLTPYCSPDPGTLPLLPPDVTYHQAHGSYYVYSRILSTTPTTVDISLPLAGNFTAPADGRYMVRVDAPVEAATRASYDSSIDLISDVGGFSGQQYSVISHSMDDRESYYMSEWTREDVGQSRLTLSADFFVNGVRVARLSPADEVLASGSMWAENLVYDKHFSGAEINRNVMTADIFEEASHSGPVSGTATLDASGGDLVEITGSVRLQYTPHSVAGSTLQTTRGELALEDPVIMVGMLSEN